MQSNLIYLLLISFTLLIIFPAAYSQIDEETLMKRGINAVNEFRYKDSLTFFDKILESDPKNVKALMNKGSVLGLLNKHSDAIHHFDKVLEIEPNKISALYNKATALSHLKEYNEALYYFDKVLEIEPKKISALYNKGTTLVYLKVYDEALNVFEKILELDPENPEASAAIANLLNRQLMWPPITPKPVSVEYRLQFSLRDSNDGLIGYIETERIGIPYAYIDYTLKRNPNITTLDILKNLLKQNYTEWQDPNPDTNAMYSMKKENKIKKGRYFEEVTIHHYGTYHSHTTVYSQAKVLVPEPDLNFIHVLGAYLDGYTFDTGDKFDMLWTFLRPID